MITILMATFNGEKYVEEQIESLLNQTYKDFKIIICDDCSTDNTYSILKQYQEKYSEKIKVFKTEKNTGSAKYNFLNMIINYKDDYVMFCDQDDVWKSDKIQLTLNEMKRMESIHKKETPIVVHTDLTIVDDKLNVLYESFKYQMKADYNKTKINNVVIQNNLTGCTGMINRALSEMIVKEPDYFVMHDWWVMLIGSAFGVISHVDKSTIMYRQHRENQVGAGNIRSLSYRINRFINIEKIKKAVDETYIQTESFVKIYEEYMNDELKSLLINYTKIPTLNKLSRIICIFKYRFFKNNFSREIAHILVI